jgi:hypothetical protein
MKDASEENRERLSQRYPILRFFKFNHLPQHLALVSEPFHDLAFDMAEGLPSGPEVSTALRKILEVKDCAVRAMI